ncbi:MAG: hypothetical protein PVJ53_16530 [Desulfobacterales bacterium]|jgi:hypothetical protein
MKKMTAVTVLSVFVLVFAFGVGIAAESMTIQGQVNEDSQLVDDNGEVYDIADTEQGMQVMDMVGEKVEVRGTVTEDEGVKEITVESFSVVN